MSKQKRLFCFGLGYSALYLAQALMVDGWQIRGTCRSSEKQKALAGMGIEAIVFDSTRAIPDLGRYLRDTTHLLSSVPPNERGDPVLDLHAPEIADASKMLDWIGYLSTTGVYGDRSGDWVDEESPLTPSGERGARRLAAETAWGNLPQPAHIFRLAGIYGPGSSALDSVRAGKAQRIMKPGQVFSRIHVSDIVQTLRASMTKPNPGRAYNVCDDDPAPPADVITYACQLLQLAPPPPIAFKDAILSPMARSFYSDNKRVSNSRIKAELGVKLFYPSYRDGLKAIQKQERSNTIATPTSST